MWTTNYFYELPDELQEIIWKKAHKEVFGRCLTKIASILCDSSTHYSLFPNLHMCDTIYTGNLKKEFDRYWLFYEWVYGESIHDLHCWHCESGFLPCVSCKNEEDEVE